MHRTVSLIETFPSHCFILLIFTEICSNSEQSSESLTWVSSLKNFSSSMWAHSTQPRLVCFCFLFSQCQRNPCSAFSCSLNAGYGEISTAGHQMLSSDWLSSYPTCRSLIGQMLSIKYWPVIGRSSALINLLQTISITSTRGLQLSGAYSECQGDPLASAQWNESSAH